MYFFVIDDTVVTPAYDGSILHGITRESVISILRDNEYKVEERRISVDEVVNAHREGRLKDAFGTGTAATIAHFVSIGYHGEDLMLPPVETRDISNHARYILERIKLGEYPDRHGWITKVQ